MSEYIPFEIQAEILKRLPTKPLIQFRSVSKSYKCLIDSPDFIVSYHPQSHDDRFILRYKLNFDYDHFYDDDDAVESAAAADKYLTLVDYGFDYMYNEHGVVKRKFFIPKVPDLIKILEPGSNVVGSSHGLLCFSSSSGYPDGRFGSEMVVLWNPSIRKSVGIRVPDMSDKPNGNFFDVGVDNVFGFGVCPVTFDPTILKITCIDYKRNRNDIGRVRVPWKVRLFTLSTGTWSILSTNLPRESIRLRGSQVVIGRFIYWLAFVMFDAEDRGSQSRFLIMSFDLIAKEFKEINLTDSLTNQGCRIVTISKLHESLVLLEYHDEFDEDVTVCCLWMMKEQGVSRSFTKLYTIDLPGATINQILGFTKTGELIIQTRQKYENYGEVQVYERHHDYADNLGIDGDEYSFFMCSYMETLLLVDQPDGYIYSNSM